MQTLPTSLSDKTTTWQKAVAFGLMGGAAYLLALAINSIAPTLIEAMKNIWMMLFIGTPLVLLTLYVVTNPLVIWGLFKTLSWNLTKFLIKMDPLSVMDRYLDYLRSRLKTLSSSIDTVSGEDIKLDREINQVKERIQENLSLGQAAITQGQSTAASTYGIKVKTDQSILETLTPLKKRSQTSLVLMRALSENWSTQIEQLSYQIAGKRKEFEIIKNTFKGLKTAEDFIGSDSEQAKLYGQSIIELENQVTQKLGYMEEFERKAKPIMSNMSIKKQADMDAGLAELEKFMQGDKLLLPDFSNTESLEKPKQSVYLTTKYKF